MKSSYIFILLVVVASWKLSGQETAKTRWGQLTLAYPVGTAGNYATAYSNHVSVNMIYGLNGGVKGVEFGGVVNYNQGDVNGLQMAGLANINRQTVSGVIASGLANISPDMVEGAELAGFLNAAGDVRGVQVSGFMNVAEAVKGCQVSGLINRAGNVKGVQVALINIADTSDYAVGLINLIRSGEKSLGVHVDETGTLLTTLRSGGQVFYSLIGFGYNLKNGDSNYATEGGVGVFLVKKERFRLRTEAVTFTLSDFQDEHYFRASFRVLPAVRYGHLELFGGPSLNYVHEKKEGEFNLTDRYLWKDSGGNYLDGLYAGAIAGVNFIF